MCGCAGTGPSAEPCFYRTWQRHKADSTARCCSGKRPLRQVLAFSVNKRFNPSPSYADHPRSVSIKACFWLSRLLGSIQLPRLSDFKKSLCIEIQMSYETASIQKLCWQKPSFSLFDAVCVFWRVKFCRERSTRPCKNPIGKVSFSSE